MSDDNFGGKESETKIEFPLSIYFWHYNQQIAGVEALF